MKKFEVTIIDVVNAVPFATVVETTFGFKNAITLGTDAYKSAGHRASDIDEIRIKKVRDDNHD